MHFQGVLFQLADCHGGKWAGGAFVGMFTWVSEITGKSSAHKTRGEKNRKRRRGDGWGEISFSYWTPMGHFLCGILKRSVKIFQLTYFYWTLGQCIQLPWSWWLPFSSEHGGSYLSRLVIQAGKYQGLKCLLTACCPYKAAQWVMALIKHIRWYNPCI